MILERLVVNTIADVELGHGLVVVVVGVLFSLVVMVFVVLVTGFGVELVVMVNVVVLVLIVFVAGMVKDMFVMNSNLASSSGVELYVSPHIRYVHLEESRHRIN